MTSDDLTDLVFDDKPEHIFLRPVASDCRGALFRCYAIINVNTDDLF